MQGPIDSIDEFERAAPDGEARYVLRLYVAGATRASSRALANIRGICEARLRGRYELEVVDVRQQPRLARDDQILAVPTLIKRLPLPLRKLIGDLSNEERVLLGLDLKPRAKDAKATPRRHPKPRAR
jgi:circadian clock protein KaiB